ncbi:imm11 family protein, partial [Pseudomonas syringae pv. coryli]
VYNRWYLGGIKHCNNWFFTDPPVEYMEPCTYEVEMQSDGIALDFSLAGYASVPVVSDKVKKSLVGISDFDESFRNVVLEPAKIAGHQDGFYVMIVETQLDCVDETRSIFEKYESEDPVRPDRAGEYRVFLNLVIDPTKIKRENIFRIKKHLGALIVSEKVKHRMEQAGVIGAIFESVNGENNVVC